MQSPQSLQLFDARDSDTLMILALRRIYNGVLIWHEAKRCIETVSYYLLLVLNCFRFSFNQLRPGCPKVSERRAFGGSRCVIFLSRCPSCHPAKTLRRNKLVNSIVSTYCFASDNFCVVIIVCHSSFGWLIRSFVHVSTISM